MMEKPEVRMAGEVESLQHRADTRDPIELGEHYVVVDDASGHAGEAQEVLGEEGDVEADDVDLERQLALAFVIHVAGPLGQPVEDSGE
jgi:hypothetical protein